MKPGTLAELTAGRSDSLDLVRLILAVFVVLSHSYDALGLNDPLRNISGGNWTMGGVAVEGFFVISGFLIAASWDRSPSGVAYFEKRVRRLYPGFLCCAFLCLFVTAPLTIDGFHLPALPTMVWNLANLRISDGPVDTSNPNISVWSLQFEAWCYIGLALFAWCGGLRNRSACAMLFALAFLQNAMVRLLVGGKPGTAEFLMGFPLIWCGRWPRMLAFFVAGTAAYAYRDRILANRLGVGLSIGILVVYTAMGTDLPTIAPVVFAYLFLTLGTFRVPRIFRFVERADLSYGIYLYGWPMQLLVLRLLGPKAPLPAFFALSLFLAVSSGLVSWYLVESRFLRRRTLDRIVTNPSVVECG